MAEDRKPDPRLAAAMAAEHAELDKAMRNAQVQHLTDRCIRLNMEKIELEERVADLELQVRAASEVAET